MTKLVTGEMQCRADHMPSPEEGKDREDVHSGQLAGKSREMVVEIITNGCLREVERHNNGDSVKPAGVTDVQLQNPALKAIMRIDMERVENNDTGGCNVNVNLKAVMKSNKESTEVKETDRGHTDANLKEKIMKDPTHTVHVDVTMQDGLAEHMPKGTWTRICRKDYRHREKGSGEQLSVLGKRVLTEIVGNDYDMEFKAQTGKRGRAESHGKGEDKISARVLDHPCRRNETTKLELPRAWEPLDSS